MPVFERVVERLPAAARPQLAVGGCTPNPRKLSPLSERIAPATPNVKLMRIGPVMFGSRCTVIVRHAEIPHHFTTLDIRQRALLEHLAAHEEW